MFMMMQHKKCFLFHFALTTSPTTKMANNNNYCSNAGLKHWVDLNSKTFIDLQLYRRLFLEDVEFGLGATALKQRSFHFQQEWLSIESCSAESESTMKTKQTVEILMRLVIQKWWIPSSHPKIKQNTISEFFRPDLKNPHLNPTITKMTHLWFIHFTSTSAMKGFCWMPFLTYSLHSTILTIKFKPTYLNEHWLDWRLW